MDNSNQELQDRYPGMLQTPVVESFRCKSKETKFPSSSNIQSSEYKFSSPLPNNFSNSTFKLNIDYGRIKRRREKPNSSACYFTNQQSFSEASKNLRMENNSIVSSQQSKHTTPFFQLKSPFNDLHIIPIDLSSPFLTQNDTSETEIPGFGILDMTLNTAYPSESGNIYEEANLGIKIANSLLGEPSVNVSQDSIPPTISNQVSEVAFTVLDESHTTSQPDSTVDNFSVISNNDDLSFLNYPDDKDVEQQPMGGGKKKQKKCSKPQSSFSCTQCKRIYKWKFNLNRHLKFECNRENAFECTICGQKFPYKQNCTQHISRTHHVTLLNNEQYLTDGLIKIHATLDTFGKATAKTLVKTSDVNEFECALCGHRLTQQQSIVQHLINNHNVSRSSEEIYFSEGWIKIKTMNDNTKRMSTLRRTNESIHNK